MIYIYRADSRIVNQHKVSQLLSRLPGQMYERALRYKFEEDTYNYIVGRLLLKKGLEEVGLGNQIEHIDFCESGKPFLNDIFFNISHTENLIVCAFSKEGEIGVDVEKEKSVNLEDFESWFTKTEWLDIINAESPIIRFYWYWTRKESIIKALGVKLSHLNQIELDATLQFIIENKKKWYLKDLDFGPGYYGAICSENPIINMQHRVFRNFAEL